MLRSLLSAVLLGAVLLAACSHAARAQAVAALYVPDSINKRVISLDPATGNVLNPALVQDARLGTAVQAIQGFDRDGILVSDQTADVVWQYTSTGTFVGVFAPAGGVNNAVLDNIRGITISRDGQRLLVTVAAGGNINAVVAFDRSGTAVPTPVVASGAGGLNSPWDVLERSADVLVGGSGNGTVLRYGLDGTPLGTFAAGLSFPQQITESRAGGVLVANFSPLAERGIYEYDAAGALVGRTTLADPLLGATRGVYDLANGNLLVATTAGVYEVTRAGALVSTKVSGGQYRYLSPALAPTTATDGADVGALRIDAPAPNPASGRAALRVSVPAAQPLRVTLVDALGRTVAVLHDGPAAAGTLALDADVSGLAPGVYVVRAAGAGVQAQTRLVVGR